jgi:hypothetical protein
MSDSSTSVSSPKSNGGSKSRSRSRSISRSSSPLLEKERKKRKMEKSNKDKKSKKDKKSHKKEKKGEKEKKSSKKDRREQDRLLSARPQPIPLSAEEQREVDDFKRAVQGSCSALRNRQSSGGVSHPLNISGLTKEQLAESLGLSKGLVRTSEQDYSITQRYASSIFGGSQDENPAKRQRMKRELTAQRAIEKANSVIAANRAATSAGLKGTEINYATADRFTSFDKRR